MPKTKVSPLEASLRQKKAALGAQIAACDTDISAQEKASAKQLARQPDNPNVVTSAAQPLVLLREKRSILARAVAQIDVQIAEAGGKHEAYMAALEPLQTALEARQAVQSDVERVFGELFAALGKLRELNECAYGRLFEAAHAWRVAGGPAVSDLPRPGFPAVRFTPDLARQFRQMPFTSEGALVGDISGRGSQIFFEASDDQE